MQVSPKSMQDSDLKICVVGSGGVGKSCVTIRLLKNKFFEIYDPTIEESYRKMITVDNQNYDVEIVDTAGQEEFEAFRDNSLEYGDGFLLVFSVTSQSSWDELKSLHKKILLVKSADRCPCVIVGNKKDLIEDRTVLPRDCDDFCRMINSPYIETSAKTGENVLESFQKLIREVIQQKSKGNNVSPTLSKKQQKTCCCIT